MEAVMQTVSILGSTGSIGVNTLDVIARQPDRYRVFALTAHSRVDIMTAQCVQFRPRYAVMVSEPHARELKDALAGLGLATEVLSGAQALEWVAAHEDVSTVMAAIVGAAGLASCIAAALAGKRLLLANKEALVVGGAFFMDAVQRGGATLLPIDSEHSAIFQSLPENPQAWPQVIDKIILTASGGPFRNHSLDQLKEVTPEQACAHPNWVMGRKISVDSATMMNKGLEVIEAHHLFGLPSEQIKVLIHPQSVVHSMVRYIDGSVIAQLSQPDMKTPIAYGLGWPLRIDAGVKELDFATAHDLSFEPVDLSRFPCLSLSYEALSTGGLAPTILNAANEVAVHSFLNHGIQFTQISELVERVLNQTKVSGTMSLDSVLEADKVARQHAQTIVKGLNI